MPPPPGPGSQQGEGQTPQLAAAPTPASLPGPHVPPHRSPLRPRGSPCVWRWATAVPDPCHPHLAYSERRRLRWAQGSRGRRGPWAVSIRVPLAQVLFPCDMTAPRPGAASQVPSYTEGKWAHVVRSAWQRRPVLAVGPRCAALGAGACTPSSAAGLRDSRQRPLPTLGLWPWARSPTLGSPGLRPPGLSWFPTNPRVGQVPHPTSQGLVPVLAPLHL